MKPTVTLAKARKMYRLLVQSIHSENLYAFDVGKYLHEINETRAYLLLEGGKFPTFRDFLNHMEQSLSWCRDRLRLHRNFVLRLSIPRSKLKKLTVGKADIIADVVTHQNIDVWIARCAQASEREIRALVALEKGKGPREPRRKKTFLIRQKDERTVNAAIQLMQDQFGGSMGDALVHMSRVVLGQRSLKKGKRNRAS